MNWCRICRKEEAASSSLVNNFGPTPDPATQLCARHHGEWLTSPEHQRFLAIGASSAPGSSARTWMALSDFIARSRGEDRVIREKLLTAGNGGTVS